MVAQVNKLEEFHSRELLQQQQFTKLQGMLAEIYGRNNFYTSKFNACGFKPGDLGSLSDLSKLPFTTKTELVVDQSESEFAANLTYPLSRYIRFHQTSGTTGEPLRVLDTPESWDWWGRCWRRVLSDCGLTAQDRLFCAFSFGPFIGFWSAVEGARQLGTLMIPGGGRSSIDRLKLMQATACTALCCTPSYALHLLEVAHENDFDMSGLNIKTLILAGEPGANVAATRKRMEEGWSASCYDHAGASEVGAFGVESREKPHGLSINEFEFIVEVLDPDTEEHVSHGEKGELVITNLGRWCFPVIRYRTGDVVKYSSATDDGFLFLEEGIIGRADDMVTVRGVNIFPSAVDNFVRTIAEVDEYRATVEFMGEMSELIIEIELIPAANAEDVHGQLTRYIADKLGLRPTVIVVDHNTLPRFEMKGKRFYVKTK